MRRLAAVLLVAVAACVAPGAASASAKCGSRFPNQVAAGYPADVTARNVTCKVAQVVAYTCSIGVRTSCRSQGHRWRVRTRPLYHPGVAYPVGSHSVATSGRRIVTWNSFADD